MVVETGANILHLELSVVDFNTVKYLSQFDESQMAEKALEALKVGVIAIQSASPNLDSSIVEEKFREVEVGINKCLGEFTNELKQKLEENFKPESGVVDRSLEKIFGSQGTVPRVFEQYFGSDGGKVSLLLERQMGPSSAFAKSLDPSHKESVICRMEESVKNHLQQKTTEIVNQFSLDMPDSAINKLKKCISDEVSAIKEENGKFFNDLRTHLGIELGIESEAEKGTQKGRDFEAILYERIADWGHNLEDQTENTTGNGGLIPRCKKGDYVITLGDTSGASGAKIVIEVKKTHYTLKNAIEEIKEAKENREARAGIMLFAKGYEPIEVGDFRQIGGDFIATVDEDMLNSGEELIFAQSAYKIARATVVAVRRKKEEKKLDFERIHNELDELYALVERISDLTKKAKKIQSDSFSIEEIANDIKDEMNDKIDEVMDLLK